MSIKRFTEDYRLRPFLATHFDVQSYIKTVIKDGNSEENFSTISDCIDEVNNEIKSYIAEHKDSLMSGMQDVAALATKYQTLHSLSSKLCRTVDKLKKDALESYDLVHTRTSELERMHSTSTALRMLRQFVHLKSQLDHHLQSNTRSSRDSDPRQLAGIAKTVSELETLLTNPSIASVALVGEQAALVRGYGQQLRGVAQDRLLAALRERSQAAVASCLQIFFNLNSLPEILLVAVDSTVRVTADLCRHSLDLEVLVAAYPELLTNTPSPPAPPPRPTATTGGRKEPTAASAASQLRGTLCELSHQWSSQVYEQSMQILVLQRVMLKKEDPVSHRRFHDVLRTGSGGPPLLHACRLVNLFWARLGEALRELCTEEMRRHPHAGARLYPSLRRAAVEVVQSIQCIMDSDAANGADRGDSDSLSHGPGFGSVQGAVGMFGCALWPQDEMLTAIGSGQSRSRVSTRPSNPLPLRPVPAPSMSNIAGGGGGGGGGGDGLDGNQGEEDSVLLTGLRPIRDRYLAQLLGRLTGPVLQMFPEMEGFASAVPSKRDLQLLISAVHAELVLVGIESEQSLVKAACKEVRKAVELLLTKVEAMVRSGSEARKLSPQQTFSRNSQQEHNGQLVTLLTQLIDALQKTPVHVQKAVREHSHSSYGSMSGLSTSTARTTGDAVYQELSVQVEALACLVDDLVMQQLILPIVDYTSQYCRTVMAGLLKEGAVGGTCAGSGTEALCSRAVQTLQKQVPELLKAQFLCLPRSRSLSLGVEEFLLRLLAGYVSVAALVRPQGEGARLRCAQDLTTLEGLLQTLTLTQSAAGEGDTSTGVLAEVRAVRRLLFEDVIPIGGDTKEEPPNKNRLLALPYISSIRPSTLLAFLCSGAPAQLPSMYDSLHVRVEEYLELLLDTSDQSRANSTAAASVCALFPADGRWAKVPAEMRACEGLKESVDVLLQRASAADASSQQHLRSWGEALGGIAEPLGSAPSHPRSHPF